ncbi:glycoside hydrolase family protein [Ruficoccus sp. ZRK36]|uniref:glycoside hydrolase family protein n=1 Tax=Ruficoccus sp. ZRK36 TaxID=2866311 RepID=UPI001C72B254|nr:glycoside hydrolase family protein [Ruficoccus sp. ZRK36]QYY35205.1 glycoside hydrolase family protein [Ruficoccus sp. ZRK36]
MSLPRTPSSSFDYNLLPASRDSGFRQDDHWIWCGSAIRDDAGTYHLFASRWPRAFAFHPAWITSSEVVRATAPTPEGPYTFQEVVLPRRGPAYWDGLMTHNPTIHRYKGTYLLYYTGTTYDFEPPVVGDTIEDFSDLVATAHRNQRIGVATAPSPEGPWTRMDQPIIEPRPGKWDHLITTNPAPCVMDDGRVLLIYKSTLARGKTLRFGAAMAPNFNGPYERISEDPILSFGDGTGGVEDPYVWQNAEGHFEMIAKEMPCEGRNDREYGGGIHATSMDGANWHLSDPAFAYSRTLHWTDGTSTKPNFVERPQLLVENHKPTHLFFAVGESPAGTHGHAPITDSWNTVIPLAPRA